MLFDELLSVFVPFMHSFGVWQVEEPVVNGASPSKNDLGVLGWGCEDRWCDEGEREETEDLQVLHIEGDITTASTVLLRSSTRR